jgi:Ser/Thr protein kinase RdoA (MazF antagonist)
LFDYLEGYFQYHQYIFNASQTGQFVSLCGQALGVLHRVLEDFEPAGCNPNGFQSRHGPRWRELPWFLGRLHQVRAFNQISEVWLPLKTSEVWEQGDWLEERLEELDERLTTADLPRLIIHGDYGPYNVFFKRGAPVLILDFELSRLDWRLTDLANALYFFAIGRSGFSFSRFEQFIQGYTDTNPVEGDEFRFLPEVWQYLLLRRIIVCWHRSTEGEGGQWLMEAQRKLKLAHWIDDHRQALSAPLRSVTIFSTAGR